MSPEEILKERGKAYGEFGDFKTAMTVILNELRELRGKKHNYRSMFIENQDVENFFLVLKLCRLNVNRGIDDAIDLSNYAELIRKEIEKEKN
jgi:hypothetical protein